LTEDTKPNEKKSEEKKEEQIESKIQNDQELKDDTKISEESEEKIETPEEFTEDEKTEEKTEEKIIEEESVKEKAPSEKPEEKKEEKIKKKSKHGADFKYIVRLSNTDINGEKNVIYGLTGVKGIGLHLAMLIADKTGIGTGSRGDFPVQRDGTHRQADGHVLPGMDGKAPLAAGRPPTHGDVLGYRIHRQVVDDRRVRCCHTGRAGTSWWIAGNQARCRGVVFRRRGDSHDDRGREFRLPTDLGRNGRTGK